MIRLAILFLLIYSAVNAAEIDLPLDSNGWTVFTASTDTRICYVDPTNGNNGTAEYYAHDDFADPFNPGSVNSYETYAAAFADTRAGYPDWILIKRGETITGTINEDVRSGRDADEPFVIGSYGASGASPIFKTGTSDGIDLGFNAREWLAVFGLEFYAHTRDPDSGDYVGITGAMGINVYTNAGETKQGILVEGCKFRFYINNRIEEHVDGVNQDFVFRRCIFLDNYSAGDHAQGFYMSYALNITFDECIFDHNGWYTDAGGSPGGATIYNHNTYFNRVSYVTITKSMFISGSNYNNKWIATEAGQSVDNTMNNNLYIGSQSPINIGTNYPDHDLRFVNPTITDNVVMRQGYTKHLQDIGWGIIISGWDGGTVTGNIVMDQRDATITSVFGFEIMDQLEDVTISDNIVYGLVNGTGFQDLGQQWTGNESDTNWDKTNISVTDNIFYNDTSSDFAVDLDSLSDAAGVTFSGNTYYSNRSESDRFQAGSTEYSITTWNALALVGTDTWEDYSFPDDTVTIETYMASIGETDTLTAFIALARLQDRYDWDTNITADAVNDYIRAGFDMDDPYPEFYQLGNGIQF